MKQRTLFISAFLLFIALLVILVVFFSSMLSFRQSTLAPTPTVLPAATPTATPTVIPTPNLPPQLDFVVSGWHSVLQKQGVTSAKEDNALLLGVIPGGKETVIYHACNGGDSYEITIGSTIEGYVYCNTPPPGVRSGEGSFDIAADRLSTASSYPVRVFSTGSETSYIILIGQPD